MTLDVRACVLPVATVAAGPHTLGRELERCGKRRDRLGVDDDPYAAPRRELVRVPEQAEPGHVGDRVGLERSDGVRSRAVQLDHRVDGCLERARGRDSVALCLQHEARTERLREEEDVARTRPGLRPDPLRMHQADDREPVLRLGVADRVAARKDRAGSTNALLGAGKHLAEHLDRELLRKGGDRKRQERRAAHRVHVVQRVRRSDGTERSRIVDERREEVDREHDRPLVVQAVDRSIVGRIETDEQILGFGRDEPCEERLETRGRVLRRTASGARERRELDGLHAEHCTEGDRAS